MATATVTASYVEQPMGRSERLEGPAFISGLSRQSTEALAKASTRMNFDAGELVYGEGEQAEGAYIVLRGKVKLVANSSDGKALILRIAQPGEIISLSAALSERMNDTSAETVEPTTVSFIPSAMSIEYSSLCQELSTLGLQRSAMSRLAKLLVGMTRNAASQGGTVTCSCPLTHEEMAQMIGTSRETVTRLLHDLRDDGIAVVKNETLMVSKFEQLRALMN